LQGEALEAEDVPVDIGLDLDLGESDSVQQFSGADHSS